MAFYIETSDGTKHAWNIPTGKPKFDVTPNTKQIIELLQADGDELELIRVRFANVPITKGNICTWRGLLSQFIYDNL